MGGEKSSMLLKLQTITRIEDELIYECTVWYETTKRPQKPSKKERNMGLVHPSRATCVNKKKKGVVASGRRTTNPSDKREKRGKEKEKEVRKETHSSKTIDSPFFRFCFVSAGFLHDDDHLLYFYSRFDSPNQRFVLRVVGYSSSLGFVMMTESQ